VEPAEDLDEPGLLNQVGQRPHKGSPASTAIPPAFARASVNSNWPPELSTGGDIVHTVELDRSLAKAGYLLRITQN
jgi:hypothetical protein